MRWVVDPLRLCAGAALIVPALMFAPGAWADGVEMSASHLPAPPLHLTLEDAIKIALTANRGINTSANSARINRLFLLSEKSVFDWKTYPTATAGVSGDESGSADIYGLGLSFRKRFSTGGSVAIEPLVERSEDTYNSSATAVLSQPLLRHAGKDVAYDNVRDAGYALRSSLRTRYNTKVNITLSVVSAFYETARQKEIFQLNERLAGRLAGSVRLARARESAGIASAIDVYRAAIQMKNAEDNAQRAKESYLNATDNLKTLLSLPQNAKIALSASFEPKKMETPLSKVVATALHDRIELAQARDELEDATRNSIVARHGVLPELSLQLEYTRSGQADDWRGAGQIDSNRWLVKLVTGSDVARTSEKLAHRQSLFRVENARLNLERAEDEIRRQSATAMRALEKADERIKINEEQIKQAEGKLKLSQIKFNFGMADNFDLIEAQMELVRARTRKLTASADYIVGTYRLLAVMGVLVERDIE